MRIIEFNQQNKIPQLSIVCLTFNAENFIDDVIDSFFLQDVINSCEIIIGDDASQDNTVDLIKTKLKNSPCPARLIIRDENVGAETNWLASIALAKSPLVAYVDGDDYYISQSKLSSDIEILEKNPNFNMIFGPAVKELDGKLTSKYRNVYKNWNPNKIDIKWVLKHGGGFYPTSTVVFRKAMFESVPHWFHRTHCTGDLSLAVAAVLNQGKIGYKSSADAVYRVHNKSRTNSKHSPFMTFRRNLRKQSRNLKYYELLAKNGYINDALWKELINKEEYIFFSKLLNVGAYYYCLKHSIKKLSFKYALRLYIKFIWIFANKIYGYFLQLFHRATNKNVNIY